MTPSSSVCISRHGQPPTQPVPPWAPGPASPNWTIYAHYWLESVGDLWARELANPRIRCHVGLVLLNWGRPGWSAYRFSSPIWPSTRGPSAHTLQCLTALVAMHLGASQPFQGRVLLPSRALVHPPRAQILQASRDHSVAGRLKRKLWSIRPKHPDTSVHHQVCPRGPVKKKQRGLDDRTGMLGASHCARGSPLSIGGTEISVMDGPLAAAIPLHAFEGEWIWTDSTFGSLALGEVDAVRTDRRRKAALRRRDLHRARRGLPALWTGMAVAPASRVLRLSALPLAVRACLVRILHDRHYTVGRNRAKGAQIPEARDALEACLLCGEPDSREHWILRCPHTPLREARERVLLDIQRWGSSLGGQGGGPY